MRDIVDALIAESHIARRASRQLEAFPAQDLLELRKGVAKLVSASTSFRARQARLLFSAAASCATARKRQ